MKLSSLFKHKAYAFGQPSDTEQDCKFAQSVLKKIRPKFKVQKVSLVSVCDDYDVLAFAVQRYNFKISAKEACLWSSLP